MILGKSLHLFKLVSSSAQWGEHYLTRRGKGSLHHDSSRVVSMSKRQAAVIVPGQGSPRDPGLRVQWGEGGGICREEQSSGPAS